MTQPPAIPLPPPPPAAIPASGPRVFDATFTGPILPPGPPPPPAPRRADGTPLPEVTEAVLALPLTIRELVRQSLDLLTRSDSGLRAASFYVGLQLLVSVGPLAILFGLGIASPRQLFGGYDETTKHAIDASPWVAWLLLAAIPAFMGYIAAAVDARGLATAVIGGRVEARPLRLRESIAVVRLRFWRLLGVQMVAGAIATAASWAVTLVVFAVVGPVDLLSTLASLAVSLVVSTPFVYTPAAVILGEVGVAEALRRSLTLVRHRKRLAVVVTLFSVLSQFIVLFGLSEGVDVTARLIDGSGLAESFPPLLAVPVAAALTFAMGTLIFLVEAIAAAPAVHAFEALTRYTGGLDLGRRNPASARRLWQPWLGTPMAILAIAGLVVLVVAVLGYPG